MQSLGHVLQKEEQEEVAATGKIERKEPEEGRGSLSSQVSQPLDQDQ